MASAITVARADRTIAGVATPDDHVLVIFGATGDLARRKLLPGLWHLAESRMMPDGYRIVGSSDDGLSSDGFRNFARRAVEEFGALKPAEGDWDAFADRVGYVPGAFGPGAGDALADAVAKAEADLAGARRLFFFAVYHTPGFTSAEPVGWAARRSPMPRAATRRPRRPGIRRRGR
jgi:glucose-6-phosphate 1-dehydrogenase